MFVWVQNFYMVAEHCLCSHTISADKRRGMSHMRPSVEAPAPCSPGFAELEGSMGVVQLLMDSGKGGKQVWEV